MGRGRQKAKHTKLARELKSFSPNVNYGDLQRELGGTTDNDENLDKWSEYTDDYSNDDYSDDYPENRSA